jgi:rubrerythrin
MEQKKLIDHLNDLLQLEHDATRAYELCIQNIKDKQIALKLLDFHSDHQHHLHKLTQFILQNDGRPKERPDLKGPFLAGMTAVMSMTSVTNALRVMLQNETLTNNAYDAAAEDQFPADILKQIRSFREDEHRHKAWIAKKLDELKGEETAATEAGKEERPGR